MAPGVLERWGKLQRSSKKTGLGIGVFLANSTIEKLGGTFAIEATDGDTAAAPDLSVSCGQTRVLVTLPLAV
jgi:hypothetical protein